MPLSVITMPVPSRSLPIAANRRRASMVSPEPPASDLASGFEEGPLFGSAASAAYDGSHASDDRSAMATPSAARRRIRGNNCEAFMAIPGDNGQRARGLSYNARKPHPRASARQEEFVE